ncbi:DUF397 domain-containing protein [Streptomyces sp. NPDC002851]
MSDRTAFEFYKSSYSGGSGECVEVARNVPAVTAVRDSKATEGPVIVLPRASWASFINTLKSDQHG